MAPYTKSNDSDAIDDGWTITDKFDGIIAHLDTETLANVMLAYLLGDEKPKDYPSNEPLGEDEDEDEDAEKE